MGDLILQGIRDLPLIPIYFHSYHNVYKNDSLYTDHTNTLRFFCI